MYAQALLAASMSWLAVGLGTAQAGQPSQPSQPPLPLRAGYAGTTNDDHTQILLRSGFNTQLYSSRLSPMFELAIDGQGEVIRVGIDREKEKTFLTYLDRSAELGLDVYVGTAYRKQHAEQLEALTSINHVVVQGPRRYLGFGERGVPSPLERKYWMGQLLQEALYIAELAKSRPNIRGFSFDLEAYAENVMWRYNSSFDDHTFFAAIQRMERDHGQFLRQAAEAVPTDERYNWLKINGHLEAYFAAQSSLITELAIEFRERVRAVNEDLELGVVYYEPNWMHDGWLRGLGTEAQPCTLFSELEYHDGIGPSSRGLAQRLKDMGVHVRYLPGLQPEHYTPRQFAQAAARGNRWHQGYWMFTSYSLWQPKPEKLWGPYILLAPARQYIDALHEINQPNYQLPEDNSDQILLTGNAFYTGNKAQTQPIVRYSRQPDVPFYDESQPSKVFNGIEFVGPGCVAWYAQENEPLVIDIDLQRPVLIDRYHLRAGHSLTDHPMVKQGKLSIETSMNGEHYYPLHKDILNPGQVKRGTFEGRNLGVRAQYVRLTMNAEKTPEFGVWSLSELALWGQEASAN